MKDLLYMIMREKKQIMGILNALLKIIVAEINKSLMIVYKLKEILFN